MSFSHNSRCPPHSSSQHSLRYSRRFRRRCQSRLSWVDGEIGVDVQKPALERLVQASTSEVFIYEKRIDSSQAREESNKLARLHLGQYRFESWTPCSSWGVAILSLIDVDVANPFFGKMTICGNGVAEAY